MVINLNKTGIFVAIHSHSWKLAGILVAILVGAISFFNEAEPARGPSLGRIAERRSTRRSLKARVRLARGDH